MRYWSGEVWCRCAEAVGLCSTRTEGLAEEFTNPLPAHAMQFSPMQCNSHPCNAIPARAMQFPPMQCNSRPCNAIPAHAMQFPPLHRSPEHALPFNGSHELGKSKRRRYWME